MLEELRFAVRCHGSTKKPALRRHCSKCARYCPSEHCAVESPNGIVLKDVEHRHGGGSPSLLNHRHNRHTTATTTTTDTTAFRYTHDDVTSYNHDYMLEHDRHRNQKT